MTEVLTRTPKVFISYSWSSSKEVIYLAEKLLANGVDVVLDKWNLKEGQDKYAFMEQCVNDPDIDRVLIYSNEVYARKANERAGGVGDETVIISGEVYGRTKQEKFIPIVAEKDDNGEPCLPTYIKSRIYIDLSDDKNFDNEFEKLLRNIFDKPLYKKPPLGNKPKWLEDDSISHFSLQEQLRRLNKASNFSVQNRLIDDFIEQYIIELKKYFNKDTIEVKQVYDGFVSMKSIRDIFLDFLDVLYGLECDFADVICKALEKIYNTSLSAEFHSPGEKHARHISFEIYKIHIWELFICIITFLRHKERYKDIHNILNNTFFLNKSVSNGNIEAVRYLEFYHWSKAIEEYKKFTSSPNRYTLLGDELCCMREKLPIYTKKNLAATDIFLCQVSSVFDGYNSWFPITYPYAETELEEWIKMKSKKHCCKMYELFGVTSIAELKELIKRTSQIKSVGYPNTFSFNTVQPIAKCVDVNIIGTMN